MKINQTPVSFLPFQKIQSPSGDKKGGAGQNAYERNQKKKDEGNDRQPDDAEVAEALINFQSEVEALSVGLSAETTGAGPGLKVTFKDSNGGILRSVSGEEFLKLRESAYAGQKSGRLLDRKA